MVSPRNQLVSLSDYGLNNRLTDLAKLNNQKKIRDIS